MKNSQKLLKAISAFTLTSVLLILVYYIGAIYPFGDHALFKWTGKVISCQADCIVPQ